VPDKAGDPAAAQFVADSALKDLRSRLRRTAAPTLIDWPHSVRKRTIAPTPCGTVWQTPSETNRPPIGIPQFVIDAAVSATYGW